LSERDDLIEVIRALEAQADVLGHATVETATAPLRARLATLAERGGSTAEAERKLVTVMFADLTGFTALSERADAEDIRDLVNASFERIGAIATGLGGYIDKFIGDELMVLFGAPNAMEDHASRALLAAHRMRAALDEFNAEHSALRAEPLSMHFGINSGVVVAGGVGFEARSEYTVMGDAVNVAARLAGEAPAGAIFVGEHTARLVGPRFVLESRGLFPLQGRAGQVEVFELRAVDAGSRGAWRPDVESGFFGRDTELAQLEDLLRQVSTQQRGQLAAVVGPAGIGKSRLLEEFRRWLDDTEPSVVLLAGAGFPDMMTAPYHVVVDLFERAIGDRQTDPTAGAKTRLEGWLDALGLSDASRGAGIEALLGLRAEAERSGLNPRERQARISSAVTGVVRALANSGPVVLVLEDLHWADQQSLELLSELATTLRDCPVLLVAVTRPLAEGPANGSSAGAQLLEAADVRLDLEELETSASGELAKALAPGLEATPSLVDVIVRKGQGNPFFVRAIISSLLDQGVLRPGTDGRLELTQPVSKIEVPDTVWNVLADRIDRLDREQKRALQMAAIVGTVFWQRLTSELAGVATIDTTLSDLERRDFVEAHGLASLLDDHEWAFRHALVHEVAYAGMLRSVRREAHRRAGRWLEEHVGSREGELAALLAYHFERGEDWPRVARFAEEAGDHASRLFANREAADSYQLALRALDLQDISERTQRQSIELAMKLAPVSAGAPTDAVLPRLEASKSIAERLEDDALALRVATVTQAWLWTTYSQRGFR